MKAPNTKMHYYTLKNPNNGYWLAEIVLLETGFFGCVSDYGDFSYAWRAFGDDFRDFVLNLDEEYLATKIRCGLNGVIRTTTRAHDKAIDRNISVFASTVLPVLQQAIREEIKREADPLHGPVDLVSHLTKFRKWSDETFGPGKRISGLIDHLKKEIVEVTNDPGEVEEWIDVAILAFDGAMRNTGCRPDQVAAAFVAKLAKNESRKWPDWKTAPEGQAIEHLKENGSQA